jgi:hypothetical protein
MLENVATRGTPDLARAVLEQYASKMLNVDATVPRRRAFRTDQTPKERTLGKLGATTTLALEMALQEQRERELLAGELLDLEFAWKEAEELARIADTLVPTHIDQALARLKARMDG